MKKKEHRSDIYSKQSTEREIVYRRATVESRTNNRMEHNIPKLSPFDIALKKIIEFKK